LHFWIRRVFFQKVSLDSDFFLEISGLEGFFNNINFFLWKVRIPSVIDGESLKFSLNCSFIVGTTNYQKLYLISIEKLRGQYLSTPVDTPESDTSVVSVTTPPFLKIPITIVTVCSGMEGGKEKSLGCWEQSSIKKGKLRREGASCWSSKIAFHVHVIVPDKQRQTHTHGP
jgi:hypothetical protein